MDEDATPRARPLRRAIPWLAAALAASLLLAALERQNRREARRVAALEAELARTRAALRHRMAGAAAPGPAEAAPPRPLAGPAFVGALAMDHLDGRRDDPLYAPYWHKQQRRIIQREYGDTLAALGLPATTIDRIEDLLTARREAAADAAAIAPQHGLEGPEAKMAVKQSVDALTEQIRQLLKSDSAYGQLESAPAVSAFEAVLSETVAADLARSGDPLTPDQLYSLARDHLASAYDAAGAPVAGAEGQDQAFLARASAYLDAAQAAALRGFLDEERQTLRVSGPADAGDSD